jgi:CheY-like chemotaxis protein
MLAVNMFAPHNPLHAESAPTPPRAAALPWTILVVDADEETRTLYRQSFSLAGCEVVEASDGREALTKALIRPPTLVVTETRLPFVDGYALCEILRVDRTTADVPILIVTAEARPAQIDRARQAGADTVLIKPTTPEQVLSETRRLVANAKDIRAYASTARATAVAHRETAARQRTRLSKSCSRFTTTTPPQTPPSLVCPTCDHPLTYEHSHVGGVSDRHPEQWDEYSCPATCGRFQYRQRTRKLRHVE